MGKILYWAFEGNEGTGKSTLSKKFAEMCGAFWSYEPNAESEELKILREMALNKNDKIPALARENLLLANRIIHHKNNVKPLINNMTTVVSDRSFLSGMVYAKLKSFSFDKFMEISNDLDIHLYPDVIIYCTSKKRKIVKNKYDIYDNADKSMLDQIDINYEEAIDYVKNNRFTKHIKIIHFENDFKKSIEENLKRLIEIIKENEVCEVKNNLNY